MDICKVYLGGKSGSKSAVDVGDRVRYWMAFLGKEVIDEIKSPCRGRGFV